MKRSRFSEEQIIGILREQESGSPTADVCRKHRVSSATFYKWKAKFGGLDVSDARRLKALEDENGKLKKLASLSTGEFDESFYRATGDPQRNDSDSPRKCCTGASAPLRDRETVQSATSRVPSSSAASVSSFMAWIRNARAAWCSASVRPTFGRALCSAPPARMLTVPADDIRIQAASVSAR